MAILFFVFSIASYLSNKIGICYILIVISISLLFTFYFLKEKQNFYKISNLSLPVNFYITAYGTVLDFPQLKNKGQDKSNTTKLFIKIKTLKYKKKRVEKKFNVSVSVIGKINNISRGDKIRINLKLSRRIISKNFFNNPINDYYLANKIHWSASCKSAQMVKILYKNRFWSMVSNFRTRVISILEKKYPKNLHSNIKKKAFIKAILLGDKSDINKTLKENLLNAGIYHIFVISGAHIGIVALLLFYVLRIIGINKKKRLLFTALSIIFYLIISGGNLPAQRAVIMALIIIISKLIYQKTNIYNVIAFSGVFIIFMNPTDILNPGFILTFTLSFGITAGRELILPYMKQVPAFTKELISASLSASIISLPLSLFFFKRYSLLSFFSAILLIPIATIIIGLSFTLLSLALFPEFLSRFILLILDPFLSIFYFIMDKILNKIDFTIYRASPNVFLILVFLGIFAFFSLKKITPKYKLVFVIILIVFVVYFALPDKKYKTKNLETFFLDVGQGDAEVIIFPNGKSLLIDGGGVYYSSFEVGKRIVLPFLLQKKIKIDWIAVSHTHPDHVRGILEIIKILKPSELWLSQKSIKDRYWKELINKGKNITKILYIDSNFKRYVGKCKIKCIYPQKVISERYANNNSSQVLKISDKFHSFLFTGDIEKKAEDLLIDSMGKKLKSDVLKVPHHGSKTSSSIKFLQLVYPKIAVFSSKKNNKFGFPHISVIKNYKKIKTKNLFTAKNGGIRIVSKNNNLYIEKQKSR